MANKPYSARQHASDAKVVEARLHHDLSYARRLIDELYVETATADLIREAEWFIRVAADAKRLQETRERVALIRAATHRGPEAFL